MNKIFKIILISFCFLGMANASIFDTVSDYTSIIQAYYSPALKIVCFSQGVHTLNCLPASQVQTDKLNKNGWTTIN